MKSINWKSLISKLLFIVLLVLAVFLARNVLRDKNGINRHTLFYEETTPVDLLVFGSSHAECSYSPLDMYEEYGIMSYNMGNSGERFPMTYYNIADAVERRCPKAIVVDLFMINEELAYYRDWDESRTITWQALDSVRLSKIKLEETYNLFKDKTFNERLELFFYLPRYHSRWKELTEEDFDMKPRMNKGAISYENPAMLTITDITYDRTVSNKSKKPFEENVKYLDKIKELCDSKGIELILVYFPYKMDKGMTAYAQWINEYASKNGCEYIDFNEFEYDYSKDFFDEGHTNVMGQLKVTKYLGEILKNKEYYSDRRNGEFSDSWNRSLDEYKELKIEAIKNGKDINYNFWEK